MPDVHLLRSRSPDGVTTACGLAFKVNPRATADVLPVTAWAQDVTCAACLNRTRESL